MIGPSTVLWYCVCEGLRVVAGQLISLSHDKKDYFHGMTEANEKTNRIVKINRQSYKTTDDGRIKYLKHAVAGVSFFKNFTHISYLSLIT